MIRQGHIQRNGFLWPAIQWPYHLFERESSTDNKVKVTDETADVLDHGKAVRCAYCKTVISYQGNAEQIGGKHVHSYVNPGGFEFTIGCYRRAWCKIMGLPMQEWSWFHGYTWQYALCPQCQEHLGWFYRNAPDNSSFYGLILDRLIIEQSADDTD
jgi:hypothetical protein